MEDLVIEEEDRRQRDLADGKAEDDDTVEKGGTSAIVGSDTWRWPFEGEFWLDEVGSYRSTIADICVREATE
jgi:hypothetical protein